MEARCREFSDGTELIVGSKLFIKIIIRDIPITIGKIIFKIINKDQLFFKCDYRNIILLFYHVIHFKLNFSM